MCLLRMIAPAPYIVDTSMMPTPRISMKWRTSSGASPISRLSSTRRMSTTSSATSWWPRLTSSSAASLLPTPLLPVISRPAPNTFTSTPWRVSRGASRSRRNAISSSSNWVVSFLVE